MSKRRAEQSAGPEGDTPAEEANTPPPRTGSLTRELARVEEINFRFYEAFHLGDIEKMAAVWSRSPYTRCVHPGWEPVVGWPGIRASWVEIFSSMASIDFELEDVHVEVTGTNAWVDDDDEFTTAVVATTIMEKVDNDWAIVLHHSSHYVDDDELDEDDLDLNGFPPTNGGGDMPN